MNGLDGQVDRIAEGAEIEAVKREVIMDMVVEMMMTAPVYRWLRHEIMTAILKSG